MAFQGLYYRICRRLVRLYMGTYRVPELSQMPSPAVYICRHHNVKGPLLSLAYSPLPLRPWVYSVFTERSSCYAQCRDYTYSVRFGWGKLRTRVLAWLTAPFFSGLVNSAGAIPVFRNSPMQLRKTFQLSVEALERGESMVIFPDVDYTAEEAETGRLYEGFLMIERLYSKRNNSHVRFVPLHVSDSDRLLAIGETVCFRDGCSYAENKDRAIEELHSEMNRLSDLYGE